MPSLIMEKRRGKKSTKGNGYHSDSEIWFEIKGKDWNALPPPVLKFFKELCDDLEDAAALKKSIREHRGKWYSLEDIEKIRACSSSSIKKRKKHSRK